jgi:hypothetical protein
MIRVLVEREGEVYPRINALGEKARRAIEVAFRSEGIFTRCTGDGNDAVPGSSMGAVNFPRNEATECCSPEQIRNPELCDVELSDTVMQLALLLEDVHVVHGFGSISAVELPGGSAPIFDQLLKHIENADRGMYITWVLSHNRRFTHEEAIGIAARDRPSRLRLR